MHPRTKEVLDHLDAARSELARAIEAIPAAARERRPSHDRWSVAEILEHLAIVEARTAGVVKERLAAARASGLGEERQTGSVSSSVDMQPLLDRSTRLTASAASQPKGGIDAATAWSRLEQQRAELRELLRSADGLALSDVKAEHPRLGLADAYQWILFVAAHERRHTAQVKEASSVLK